MRRAYVRLRSRILSQSVRKGEHARLRGQGRAVARIRLERRVQSQNVASQFARSAGGQIMAYRLSRFTVYFFVSSAPDAIIRPVIDTDLTLEKLVSCQRARKA